MATMTLAKAADTIPYPDTDQGKRLSRAYLLINLGSPESPTLPDVRRYLDQFLMDPHVIGLPRLARRFLVSAFVLPFRPKRTVEAYQSIWPEGQPEAPLLTFSRALVDEIRDQLDGPVALAMRYGRPSIEEALASLPESVEEVAVLPLYPQHADSTSTTSFEEVRRFAGDRKVTPIPAFYQDDGYLDAQAAVIREHLPEDFDLLLLSYHGLPESHMKKADPTGQHCLQSEDCCARSSAAHATCYRHQVFETSKALAERLGLGPDRYRVSFQSRLGFLPWLTPYTDQVLEALPEEGIKRVVVACPAFVADNLETLEEMGMQGREIFRESGGETFHLVPCMNSDPRWARALADLLNRY